MSFGFANTETYIQTYIAIKINNRYGYYTFFIIVK